MAWIDSTQRTQTSLHKNCMNKRHLRRTSRRLYVREQLTAYGLQITHEIPYHEQYLQFMVTERGCQESTATNNLKIIRQFARFLKQEYGMDSFGPTEVTPRHIRRYLTYLKNERGNSASTRNTKLAVLGSYYLFLECYEYIEEVANSMADKEIGFMIREFPEPLIIKAFEYNI